MIDLPREVMDIRQAAEYLGISADTLYRYAGEGLIPAFKLGNRWRFKKSLLDEWMVKLSWGEKIMKALTLTQPWASLMHLGRKRIETRSWSTNYRGLLVIHAAKGFPKWAKETCHEEPFVSALAGRNLPVSRGLCVVRLVDVQRTENVRTCYPDLFPHEEPFGDYSPGRYAWVTEFVRPLNDERIVKGALGLWEWPEAV